MNVLGRQSKEIGLPIRVFNSKKYLGWAYFGSSEEADIFLRYRIKSVTRQTTPSKIKENEENKNEENEEYVCYLPPGPLRWFFSTRYW